MRPTHAVRHTVGSVAAGNAAASAPCSMREAGHQPQQPQYPWLCDPSVWFVCGRATDCFQLLLDAVADIRDILDDRRIAQLAPQPADGDEDRICEGVGVFVPHLL